MYQTTKPDTLLGFPAEPKRNPRTNNPFHVNWIGCVQTVEISIYHEKRIFAIFSVISLKLKECIQAGTQGRPSRRLPQNHLQSNRLQSTALSGAIAFSSVAIALVGFLVWGHHLFVSGQSQLASAIFSFLTLMVAIPSGIKVFNWLATMYRGSIALDAPMLYAIGGLTGIFLGSISTDVHLHDTYFVVAHFHYVMMGGTVIGFLAGLHYWWPKMFGRMYSEKAARVSCALIFIGFNMTFLSQFVLGSRGMPRRYATYLDQFQPLYQFSTFGAWIIGLGFFLSTAHTTTVKTPRQSGVIAK